MTNKHRADQLIYSNEIECKNIRSRNSRRRKDSTNSRSDSADTLSVSSSKEYHRQVSNEQGANSD